ncbi:MAG: hypothetical protein ACRYG8_23740 [Janthinobacterium lividum]
MHDLFSPSLVRHGPQDTFFVHSDPLVRHGPGAASTAIYTAAATPAVVTGAMPSYANEAMISAGMTSLGKLLP